MSNTSRYSKISARACPRGANNSPGATLFTRLLALRVRIASLFPAGRAGSRRPRLGLEAMEDRTVPTAVSVSTPTLTIWEGNSDSLSPHHEVMNAWQRFEEKGIPLPARFDPVIQQQLHMAEQEQYKAFRERYFWQCDHTVPPPRDAQPR